MSIRIILAEDQILMREGLRNMLLKESSIQIIGEAGDGRHAVEMALASKPDIVIMDISMPNLNGIEAAKQIHETEPEIKVVMLSMHKEENFVLEALKAGVSGYVLKDCTFKEVLRAIETVMSDRVYLSPDIAGIMVEKFRRGGDEGDKITCEILTSREIEVVQLIAEGKTNKEIALILHIADKTVDTHRQQLMKKLNRHTIAELTQYAILKGIIEPK